MLPYARLSAFPVLARLRPAIWLTRSFRNGLHPLGIQNQSHRHKFRKRSAMRSRLTWKVISAGNSVETLFNDFVYC
jgi:hypothetical protein